VDWLRANGGAEATGVANTGGNLVRVRQPGDSQWNRAATLHTLCTLRTTPTLSDRTTPSTPFNGCAPTLHILRTLHTMPATPIQCLFFQCHVRTRILRVNQQIAEDFGYINIGESQQKFPVIKTHTLGDMQCSQQARSTLDRVSHS